MTYYLTAAVTEEDKWFVARAVESGVMSQEKTAPEALENLKEAAELFLEHPPKVIIITALRL